VARTLAFAIGLCIAAVGAIGVAVPTVLYSIARPFVAATALAYSVLAVVRIGFGAVLIAASSSSRMPRAVRILGWLIVVLGLITAITALAGDAWARGAIQDWMQRGRAIARLTAVPIIALGTFVAYACAPARATWLSSPRHGGQT
jgi:hypothetical protein